MPPSLVVETDVEEPRAISLSRGLQRFSPPRIQHEEDHQFDTIHTLLVLLQVRSDKMNDLANFSVRKEMHEESWSLIHRVLEEIEGVLLDILEYRRLCGH